MANTFTNEFNSTFEKFEKLTEEILWIEANPENLRELAKIAVDLAKILEETK